MSLSKRLRPDVEAAPWVIEEVTVLEAEIERLHEQVQDMIDASGQECGCGYDKPDDVCLGHWPAYKKQQDEIGRLREAMTGWSNYGWKNGVFVDDLAEFFDAALNTENTT